MVVKHQVPVAVHTHSFSPVNRRESDFSSFLSRMWHINKRICVCVFECAVRSEGANEVGQLFMGKEEEEGFKYMTAAALHSEVRIVVISRNLF